MATRHYIEPRSQYWRRALTIHDHNMLSGSLTSNEMLLGTGCERVEPQQRCPNRTTFQSWVVPEWRTPCSNVKRWINPNDSSTTTGGHCGAECFNVCGALRFVGMFRVAPGNVDEIVDYQILPQCSSVIRTDYCLFRQGYCENRG